MRLPRGGLQARSAGLLRRAVLLTVLLAGLLAGPGAAAGRAAEPVTGGSGFADAPLLGPGAYSDTLLPRETLFYAVALRTGERLRVRATIDVSVGSRSVQDFPDAAAAFETLDLYTPLRQFVPRSDPDADVGDDSFETLVLELEGPRVLSVAAAGRRAARNERWIGPGIYHLAIAMSKLTSSLGATVEFPLRIAIEVVGRPANAATVARPSPGPLGDPRAGPVVVAAAAADDEDRTADARDGTASLVAGSAGGLVLGAAAGYGIVVWRRQGMRGSGGSM